MRKLRLRIGLFLLVFILCGNTWGFAEELFAVEDIRPGLRGIGKTVVSGNTIEKFNVEVLGLVPQSPPLNNLIMVKVSGEIMDESGGIAQGMSGSPIYIQDRLLGALGYTYAMTDHRIGLVTPAVDMFKIYEEFPSTIVEEEPILPEGFEPVRSPLIIQGLNKRNTSYLEKALGLGAVQTMPALGSVEVVAAPLKAGSMVGVQLLRGDFQVASFGTVTHVRDDGKFIGFGHPFTHKGAVDYFASAAYVHYTLPSIDMPSKIVSLGSTIGNIKQDRIVGIGGELGVESVYLPVSISVIDKDRNIKEDFYVETIRDESAIIPLTISSAYQGVDATLDRLGAGTSFVRLEFIADNLSQRIIRENLFYSDTDIAVWSLTDLLSGLELLVNNSLQEVDLKHVKVDVEVELERKTATIESARPNKQSVRPGESVDVEVTIRPYRGASEVRTLRMEIPEDASAGLMNVAVRSGAEGYYLMKPPVDPSILSQNDFDDEPIKSSPSGAETLDVLIAEYMDGERNNEIILEYYPLLENSNSEEELDDEEFDDNVEIPNYYRWDDNSANGQRIRLSTQFVLDGMVNFDLNIY